MPSGGTNGYGFFTTSFEAPAIKFIEGDDNRILFKGSVLSGGNVTTRFTFEKEPSPNHEPSFNFTTKLVVYLFVIIQ